MLKASGAGKKLRKTRELPLANLCVLASLRENMQLVLGLSIKFCYLFYMHLAAIAAKKII